VALDIKRMNILPRESQSCSGMAFSFLLKVTASEIQIITVFVPPTAHKKEERQSLDRERHKKPRVK